jgi:hypothetical protein
MVNIPQSSHSIGWLSHVIRFQSRETSDVCSKSAAKDETKSLLACGATFEDIQQHRKLGFDMF